jgi:energy-coupling factor transporter ATP-binding protein EcfA2
MSQEKTELKRVKFLRDTEAKEDALTHKQTAAFLAEAIKSNPELRSIALIGPWGSGKSTVIGFLQEIIEQEDTKKHEGRLERIGTYLKGFVSWKNKPLPTETYVFKYDAWSHQSEVPKRSFIEALLADLIPDDSSALPRWSDAVDRIAGRVEITDTTEEAVASVGMIALFISFFLSSLGMTILLRTNAFLDASKHYLSGIKILRWIDENFLIKTSWILITSPVLVATCITLFIIPKGFIKFILGMFGINLTHKTNTLSEITYGFTTKKPSRIKKRVIKDPTPTSIEFQKLFMSITKAIAFGESFAKKGIWKKKRRPVARIVIIIDNMDRLPDEEALAIWPVMRNFFLGQDAHTAKKIEQVPILVIAPLNIDALIKEPADIAPNNDGSEGNKSDYEQGGSESSSENKGDNSKKREQKNPSKPNSTKALLEKSFDLLVSMPNPRLSSWHNYLEKMLRECLGDDVSAEEMSHIIRIVDNHIDRNNIDVTPRGINSIVNSIAVIWMRWKSKISAESITSFAIDEYKIKANVMAYIKSQPRPFVSLFDPAWEPSFYAMAHGVSMDKAFEVVKEEPIREAIEDGDSTIFLELAKEPEFRTILNRVIGGSSNNTRLSFSEILNVVEMLDILGEDSNSYFSIWREIPTALLKSFPPPQAEEDHARQLPIFFRKTKIDPSFFLQRYIDSALSNTKNPQEEEYRVSLRLLQRCDFLLPNDDHKGTIVLRCKAHIFLRLISDLRDKPNALNAIALKNHHEIRGALLNLLGNRTDEYEQATRALLDTRAKIEWDEVLHKLHEYISRDASFVRDAALHMTSILGETETEDGTVLEKTILKNGFFASTFSRSVRNDDVTGVATFLATILMVPPAKWPSVDEDEAKWIDVHSDLSEEMSTFAIAFNGPTKTLSQILNAGSLHKWFLPLVSPAVLSILNNELSEEEVDSLKTGLRAYSVHYPPSYFKKIEDALNQLG